ncbi:MAG: hypothetical protein IRY94_20585 [Rhodospirillaceae bacterium]|nr:hypothetical protein [Rhodospirillaceae bacterium]
MVSPYLLRRKRSLEEATAERAAWALAHVESAGVRWPVLQQLHRIALFGNGPSLRAAADERPSALAAGPGPEPFETP